MSRVEPREPRRDRTTDARDEERDAKHPSKAEGEEGVVDEALRKNDYDETLKIPQDRA